MYHLVRYLSFTIVDMDFVSEMSKGKQSMVKTLTKGLNISYDQWPCISESFGWREVGTTCGWFAIRVSTFSTKFRRRSHRIHRALQLVLEGPCLVESQCQGIPRGWNASEFLLHSILALESCTFHHETTKPRLLASVNPQQSTHTNWPRKLLYDIPNNVYNSLQFLIPSTSPKSRFAASFTFRQNWTP